MQQTLTQVLAHITQHGGYEVIWEADYYAVLRCRLTGEVFNARSMSDLRAWEANMRLRGLDPLGTGPLPPLPAA